MTPERVDLSRRRLFRYDAIKDDVSKLLTASSESILLLVIIDCQNILQWF